MGKERRSHGEGSKAHQRKDGRWTASVTFPNGGRKSVYGKTERAAIKARNDLLRTIADGEAAPNNRITVAQWLPRWLEGRRPRLAFYTAQRYEQQMAGWADLLGHKKLARLTVDDIEDAEAVLLGRLAASTVHVAHGMLHSALKEAKRRRLITADPMADMASPKADEGLMNVLSEAEVERLVADTGRDRYHCLWVTLVTTGLRLREALGLRWRDVDLESRTVVVRAQLPRRRADSEELLRPKSSSSRRTVAVSAGLADLMAALQARQAQERDFAEGSWRDRLGLVFTTSTGAPLYGSQAREGWLRAARRLGFAPIRIHDLRHTFATILLKRGVHPKLVSEMLGHADVSMTMRIYAHVLPSMSADGAAQMDTFFSVKGSVKGSNPLVLLPGVEK